MLGVATAIGGAATYPASAPAATAACAPGPSSPTCFVRTGKVTKVSDGDTLDVDVAGDGTTRPVRVRMIGIQAMELTTYSSNPSRRRGECHAVAATARLEQLIRAGGGSVRLASQDPNRMTGSRWHRSVAIRSSNGWVDLGRVMVAEGHARWLASHDEYAWNSIYHDLAQRARGAGRRLYNPRWCGNGPSEGAPLDIRVNWNAPGNDTVNPNGEWVEISNSHPSLAVSLRGWWLRDSALRRYVFPSSAAVPPASSIRVHVGSGSNSRNVLYWGLSSGVFDNASTDGRGVGDGAYLFDSQGDLRESTIYP
jgi:micrococcal nuclease